jgi:D-glycero-alpha-D-manno-heptose-7-phosphate kinase
MIKIKSPTRVDVSGGTLDMWPLFNFVGQCRTINVAIDIWTIVDLNPTPQSQKITIESLDYNQKWEFSNIEDFLKFEDKKTFLYQATIEFFKDKIKSGFHLTTKSESPIGGGLGGSSSLMISMMKAFAEMANYKFKDIHHMVHVAHNIESKILVTPTGTQDYYPAVSGGLSILDYGIEGIQSRVFDVTDTPLVDNFLLVYTGKTHHSGLNNFEVLKACTQNDSKVLNALKGIKDISEDMYAAIQEKHWHKISDLFQREYTERIKLTPAFTSPEIEHLSKLVIANGATGVKICGAGGGGCVLVWVPPSQRQKVIEACEKEKFQCLKSKPISPHDLQPSRWLMSYDL